jgi:putative chitinase
LNRRFLVSITVRSGDSLSGIAQRNGVALREFIRANPQVTNPNLIYPGQVLNLPGWNGESHFEPPPPPPKVDLGSTPRAGYVVHSGDTLGAIAARFGTSYQAIAAANGISNPNLIYVGQVLHIPGASAPEPAAPQPAPAPAPSPEPSGARYTVQPGDTLGAIGARFGVSYRAIAEASGIENPNRIYPGQVLTIPGADESVTGPAPIAPVAGRGDGGVSIEQLRAIIPSLPRGRAETLLPYLNDAMVSAGITTPLRQAAFIAQLAQESVGLTAFEEFASGDAYEGRRDLGNVNPGDGVRYKGRGPIQLTGRSNYRAAGHALGIDLEGNPARAADFDVGFRTAAWFWNSRNLSTFADARDFDAITYRINGGYNGKPTRDAYYARAKQVLGV